MPKKPHRKRRAPRSRSTMTAAQFRAGLARAGLTQVGFSRLANTNPRSVRRWALGEAPIPGPVEVLLKGLPAAKKKPKP